MKRPEIKVNFNEESLKGCIINSDSKSLNLFSSVHCLSDLSTKAFLYGFIAYHFPQNCVVGKELLVRCLIMYLRWDYPIVLG